MSPIPKHIEQKIEDYVDNTYQGFPAAMNIIGVYRAYARFGYQLAQEEMQELVEALKTIRSYFLLDSPEQSNKAFDTLNAFHRTFATCQQVLSKYEEARKL